MSASDDPIAGVDRTSRLRLARFAGIVLQALILGTLLFVAIGQLVALGTGTRLFRYQAF